MKRNNCKAKTLLACAALFAAQAAITEERILADDGREVLLRDDGTWEYVSDDRFGTTASGERVRLKADGDWEIVPAAAVASSTPAGAIVADTGPALWALREVTIETSRGKRSSNKKGVTKKTATVFNVEVQQGPAADGAVSFTLGEGNVSVVDSDGREYPVLDIEPTSITLDAGERQRVVVRVDGSPHWFTTKFYELRIAAQALGNRDEIRLKRALSNVRRIEVDD